MDVCVSSCVHSVYLLLALLFFSFLPVKPNHDVPDENIYWIIGRWFYLPFRLEMLYMSVIGLMILWPFHWQNEPTSELTKKKNTPHTRSTQQCKRTHWLLVDLLCIQKPKRNWTSQFLFGWEGDRSAQEEPSSQLSAYEYIGAHAWIYTISVLCWYRLVCCCCCCLFFVFIFFP